jgi:hypothetical protein
MIGQSGRMQISAANLLLAAQQSPQASAKPGTAFTDALAAGEATKSAKKPLFSPPDFSDEAKPEAAPRAVAAAPAAQASPMRAAMAAPGSQLDIRV